MGRILRAGDALLVEKLDSSSVISFDQGSFSIFRQKPDKES
jgi:hypothetical protein